MTQERSDNKLGKEVAARFSSGHWVSILTLTVLMKTFDHCLWKHQESYGRLVYHERMVVF